LSKPREEDNKEIVSFSEVHRKIVKKYNLKLQQMATSECTNTMRKDDPTWDLVA
jgi:hypothetical protein